MRSLLPRFLFPRVLLITMLALLLIPLNQSIGAGLGVEQPTDTKMVLLILDTTAPINPTISSPNSVGSWRNDNTVKINIHPDATDTAGSGVAGYSITFSKDTTELPPPTICTTDTPNTTDTYTSPALDDGEWYANLRTVDNAGNWTTRTVDKGPFKIDRTKPELSVKINNGDAATDDSTVTLNLTASDNLSGLYWMQFRNKGEEKWSGWENFSTTKEWNLDLSEAALLIAGGSDGPREVEVEIKDRAYNHSEIATDTIELDTNRPVVRMLNPFVSTRISKNTTFKVKWWSVDISPSSGVEDYTVRYRPSTSRKWRTWKSHTTDKEANFTGKAGVTYYFRTYAFDNAGNKGWSKVYKTIVPFNEGMSLLRRIGFFGYKKLGRSQNYLSSVRYSYKRGHTLVYKLYRTNGIGLIVTKGPNMGRAKIYVDGKLVKTVDAHKSKTKARQLIFYKGFKKKGTHWLKVVNLGTPGRARFEVDGVVRKQ